MTRKPPAKPDEDDDDASPDTPRKERVLHTRVPAVLEEELKRFAKNLRVPVSNVVRAILEDALKMADRATGSVEDRLNDAVAVVRSERETIQSKLKRLDPLDDVLAFQPLVVALPTECTACQGSLRRGESGWLGMTTDPSRRVIVCGACLPKPDPDPTHTEKEPTP
ncbi:MAG: hypothetical protein IT374_16930 [Polyangiaceae bacterium]|nr:hypothetical protein [Polyangiaceae bacterium]